MFKNYFKIAWRNLFTHKQFTLLNLAGLSIGLASAVLIFLWVNDELNVDKFNKKDDRLYKVLFNIPLANTVLTLQSTPSSLAPALIKEMPEVEKVVSLNHFIDWFAGEGVATIGDNHIKAKGMFASKDLFNVFSYELIQGNKDVALANKNGVVISEKLARRLFNTTDNLVGKTIQWDHRMKFKDPLHISAVVKDPPDNSTIKFDIIFSYELMLEHDENSGGWRSTYSDTYVILREGTDPRQFEKKIAGFAGLKEPINEKNTLFLQQFSKIYLHNQYENGEQVGGRIRYVRLFSLVALFILIIACINFMNLSTAQASRKMKEIGVKKTIGASRKSLMWQFILESIFIALLAVVIAILLITLVMPQFNQITGKQLQLNFQPSYVLFISAIALFTGILSGSYAAFYLSSFNPVAVLKGKLTTSIAEVLIRKGLVIFQFALSVAFIIGFIVINKQISFVHTKNLGYNRDNIITFKREGRLNGDAEAFLSALKDIPGVVKVGAMAGTILDGRDNQSGFSWRGQDADRDYIFKSPRISYDAIEAFGLKVLAGRSYARHFKDDNSKIILNESALKMMELTNPIGKIIKNADSESEIIGVVNDFQLGSVHNVIEPLIFRFRPATVATNILVKVKQGTEQSVIKQLEQCYKKFHPNYPFEFSFLDSDYKALYSAEQRIGTLSRCFASLAIVISCLGLFGLAAFTAQKKQKEIGIRKVLGASVGNITTLLSKDFIQLVFIAILIASPLAWYCMKKWLENFAYRIEIQWWMFVLAGTTATTIALITISFQAIKAAIANPVKSLRTE